MKTLLTIFLLVSLVRGAAFDGWTDDSPDGAEGRICGPRQPCPSGTVCADDHCHILARKGQMCFKHQRYPTICESGLTCAPHGILDRITGVTSCG